MKKEMKSIIIYIMVCILALNHLGNSGLVVYAQDNETEETKIEKAIEDGAVETEKLSEVSNLRVKEQNASSVAIEWDKPVTGAVKQYEVYRDGSLVTQTDQLLYKDSAITKDCKYEYQIIAKGYQANEETKSDILSVNTYDSMTIEKNTTLSNNITVNDLIIKEGTLSLDEVTVTVLGTVTVEKNGKLEVGKGTVTVEKNMNVTGNGTISMSHANGNLVIGGDLSFSNWGQSKFEAGVLEIRGNFIQDTTAKNVFVAERKHITKFSGNVMQTIQVLDYYSTFGTVKLCNESKEGILISGVFRYEKIERNGVKLTKLQGGETGFTLKDNKTIEGDYYLALGEIDLRGKTLRIKGDFIQGGGEVLINGGTLIVDGDYRLQGKVESEDKTVYGYSTGSLVMNQAEDKVIVKGQFITETTVNHEGLLTDGQMEVSGNITQKNTVIERNFYPTNNHVVILKGEDVQTISFAAKEHNARFAGLKNENASKEGVKVIKEIAVDEWLEDNGKNIDGTIILLKQPKIEGDTISANLTVNAPISLEKNLTTLGKVVINADVALNGHKLVTKKECVVQNYSKLSLQQGEVICDAFYLYCGYAHIQGGRIECNSFKGNTGGTYLEEGSLICHGNVFIDYYCSLYMEKEGDYVLSEGDFTIDNYYESSFKQGSLEVKGDFIQKGSRGVITYAPFILKLSGEKKQNISLESDNNHFATLELTNTSTEGVYANKSFQVDNLMKHNTMLSYASGGEEGFTLEKDTVIEGDYCLASGTLDLNGYTLTIKGNFTQAGGTVFVNQGKLEVQGDYYIQEKQEDNKSQGILKMTGENDVVHVAGSFLTQSSKSHNNMLTNGRLEIEGDFTVIYAGQNNFSSTNDHEIVFCGAKKQTITVPTNNDYTEFAHVIISNVSEEGVYLSKSIKVSKELSVEKESKLHGAFSLAYGAKLTSSYVNGDLALMGGNILPKKLEVAGTLYISGYVTLYEHKINAKNIKVTSGTLNVNTGLVTCEGDFQLGSVGNHYTALNMNHKDGKLLVKGNFTYGYEASLYETCSLTDGILEIKGDFKEQQKVYRAGYFSTTKEHKILLTGDTKQEVAVYTNTNSFATVEMNNTSKEGVYFLTNVNIEHLIQNNTNLTKNIEGIYGYQLTEDTVIEGDLNLLGGTLDLNGYTLTVKGNIYQMAGCILMNQGKLIVEKDYRIQSKEGEEYKESSGILSMTKEKDFVLVKGDFVTQSVIDHNGYLTAGEMELKGDFIRIDGNNRNFYATGTHTVIFSGTKNQRVTMNQTYYSSYYSKFSHVSFHNDLADNIVLEGAILVEQSVLCNENMVKGTIAIGNQTKLLSDIYVENVTGYEVISLKEDVTIKGIFLNSWGINLNGHELNVNDYVATSALTVGKGTLYCKGNFTTKERYGEVFMTQPEDTIFVEGDFLVSGYNEGTFSAGTLEVKGNFIQKNYFYGDTTHSNFSATGEHITILSGDKPQTIVMESPLAHFHILKIENTSKEGIIGPTVLQADQVIRNQEEEREPIIGEQEEVRGFTLTEDTKISSNLSLVEGTIDLNGHTLTIEGDFIQQAGRVRINGGSLLIRGDYRMQKVSGETNQYTSCQSILEMTKEGDYILVEGDFYQDSNAKEENTLTEGTLEVQGNFTVGNAFYPRGNHTVVFTGSKEQHIYMKDKNGQLASFEGLRIEKQTGKVIADTDYKVNNSIVANEFTIEGNGACIPDSFAVFSEATFDGTVKISKNIALEKDLVLGNLILENGTLRLNGQELTVEGNVEILGGSSLQVENGSLLCEKNMGFYGYSSLFMTEEAGKILVYGDFTMASTLQMDHHLTAGTLEVKGDFTQSANYDYYGKNFYAQGSHKVILSGKTRGVGSKNGKDYIQTVTFTQPGMSKMNTLILTKNQKKYSFESKGKEIEDLETIAAKVQYENREEAAPMPPIALSVMEVTCTSGVLTWEESKSETPVMGYDIYQDGKKIATISGTSYHLQGLQPNTSYEYAVQAFTENGTYSLLSDSITVTTAKDTTSPEAVKGLRMGKRTGATITLKWDKATDDVEIMDYEIYRNQEKIATVTECIYEDKELKENTTYEYYVIARDTSSQCSEPSNTISASTASPRITRILPQDQEMIGGNTLPLTVEFLDTGNATNNQIKVEYQTKDTDWVPFHDGYLLQQEGDKLGTLKVEKEFSLEEIQGEEITVRITLKDKAGVETSQEVTYYIDKEGATAPEGVNATSKNQVVTLEWKPSVSGDCNGYLIYRRSEEEQDYKLLATIEGKETLTYEDKDVSEGNTYFYQISAIDSFGQEGEKGNEVSVVAEKDYELPSIVSIVPGNSKIGQTAQITVTAKDNIGVDSIKLSYRLKGTMVYTELETKTSKDNQAVFTLDTTDMEGIYEVRAIATDQEGNESDGTYYVEYEIDHEAPEQVKGLKAESYSTGVILTWEENSAADLGHFIVEQKGEDGTFHEVCNTGTTLGAQLTNLTPNTTYIYRVIAVDKVSNQSNPSEEIEITTTVDDMAPNIMSIGPEEGAYAGNIPVEVYASDDTLVDRVEFQYSYDKETYQTFDFGFDFNHSNTFSTTLDTQELEEGTIYVRGIAIDTQGKESTDNPVITYTIDRTAPEKVASLQAKGVDGGIMLTFSASASQDVESYEIYRSLEGEERFKKIGTTKQVSYTDYNVVEKNLYNYYVVPIDAAGNKGEPSKETIASPLEDKEGPTIYSLSMNEGNVIGGEDTLSYLIGDHQKIDTIYIEIQKEGDETFLQRELVKHKINAKEGVFDIPVDVSKYEDGSYILYAFATDVSQNVGEVLKSEITIDNTAPTKPDVSITKGNYALVLNWDKIKDEDLSQIWIYRKSSYDTTYQLLTELEDITQISYKDKEVEPGIQYSYQIVAVDKAGNKTVSDEVRETPLEVDDEAPTAVIMCDSIAIEGYEFVLDASASTDNVGIKSYTWEMGDENNSVRHGKTPRFTYKDPGTYTVKLTIEDKAGNKSSTEKKIEVLKESLSGSVKIQVKDEKGNPIKNASIYVNSSDEPKSFYSNEQGIGVIREVPGIYQVAVYKDGYQAVEQTVEVAMHQNNTLTIVIAHSSVVSMDLSVQEMSIEEMLQKGIDIYAPENQHSLTVTATYVYLRQREVIYFIEENNELKPSGSGNVHLIPHVEPKPKKLEPQPYTGGGKYIPEKVKYEDETSDPCYYYVSVTANVSWLKDMFEVGFHVYNHTNSKNIKLTKNEATLHLPQGVSFASMQDGKENQATKHMDDIEGQSSESVSWYVRGDKQGVFRVSADYSALIMPFKEPIYKRIYGNETIKSSAGSGLMLAIYAESSFPTTSSPIVKCTLTNMSTKTFYNVKISANSSAIKDGTIIRNQEEGNAIGAVSSYTIPYLEPDDSITTYSRPDKITGNTMRPGKQINTMVYNYFSLVNKYISHISDENLGVKVYLGSMPGSYVMPKGVYYVSKDNEEGDPVETTTGAFTESYEALSVQGVSSVSFDLSYDSTNENKGDMGYGWTSNQECSITDEGGYMAHMNFDSKTRITFIRKEYDVLATGSDGAHYVDVSKLPDRQEYHCITQGYEAYTMVKENGTYKVSLPNGMYYEFDEKGHITKMVNENGETYQWKRDKNTMTVTESATGASITVTYNKDNLVEKVSDSTGRATTFVYDDAGNLKTICNPLKETTSFTYDDKHHILTATDGNGKQYVTNTYDEKGRVVTQDDGMSHTPVMKFSYKEDADTDRLTTTITNRNGDIKEVTSLYGLILKSVDEKGNKTLYTYDENYHLASEVTNQKYAQSYTNNKDGCITLARDEEGNKTEYTYDDNNNVTSVIGSDGSHTYYTYNDKNLMTSMDRAGEHITYEYNKRGQLIKEICNNQRIKRYEYNDKGWLTKTIDGNGNETKYHYNNRGFIDKVVNPDNTYTEKIYDALGHVLTETDEAGQTTSYTYDANGRVKTMTDRFGKITRYTYNNVGWLLSEKTPDNGVTTYEYDYEGNQTKITGAKENRKERKLDRNSISLTYDELGNVTTKTDELGKLTKYEYNDSSELIRETKPDGSKVRYGYYLNGNLNYTIDEEGHKTTYTYNKLWQLIMVTDAKGNSTHYEYDEYGNQNKVIDALGNETNYTYNTFHEVTSMTDAKGNQYTYEYDKNGNQTKIGNPLGEETRFTVGRYNR